MLTSGVRVLQALRFDNTVYRSPFLIANRPGVDVLVEA